MNRLRDQWLRSALADRASNELRLLVDAARLPERLEDGGDSDE